MCVGLVQHDKQHNVSKPIYVHSKLIIVDDEYLDIGSTNMDNMSFYYSSEVSLRISDPKVAKDTRDRLFREHLGPFYRPAMYSNFKLAFLAFRRVASLNLNAMRQGQSLVGRPVWVVPALPHQTLMKYLKTGSKVNRVLAKMGIGTDDLLDRMAQMTEQHPRASKFLKIVLNAKL